MFLQGRMLHCDDRMLYVGASWSHLDKVFAFINLGAYGKSFDLDKLYLTVTRPVV
jgi:hypothetical protein